MWKRERAAAARHASVFAALGDPTRLYLLRKLSDGRAQSISRLAGDTALSRQAVTKHLRALERAGLVASARVGRESRFRYRPQRMQEAKAYLETVSAQWDEAAARLREHLEDGMET